MKRYWQLLAGLAITILLTTGCIPILVHAASESSSRERTSYSAYRDTQMKINSDRELAGLPPQPIFTLNQWRASVGRSTNAPLATPRAGN